MSADVTVYASGLLYASVCAAEDVPPEMVETSVNFQHPTGISSPWRVAPESFATGEPNPHPCEDGPARRHWLLSC